MHNLPARPGVLIVSRNFPPLRGGMERVNHHLLLQLAESCDVGLVGPSGAGAHVPPQVRALTAAASPAVWFLTRATLLAAGLAWRRAPRIVIAGSGVNILPAWLAARLSGAKLVTYLHGLDVVVDSALYRWLFLPLVRCSDACLANSRATAQAAVRAGIDPRKIHLLHPGVTLPQAEPPGVAALRRRWDLDGRPVLLSVGRLTRRKGLAEFVREALPAILASQPQALLLVAGEEPHAALRGEGSLPALHKAIREVGAQASVRLLGRIDDRELSAAYAAADVMVFPVLDLPGDMEGFGMVAIEAAAHGTPTVAFSTGGVADAVADGRSGRLVGAGDYAGFAAAVIELLAKRGDAALRGECRRFAEAFAWPRFGARLREILDGVGAARESRHAG